MSRPSAKLARVSIRFRYAIAAAALAVTAMSAFPAIDLVRLRVKTNFFSLLPQDHPSVRTLMQVVDKLGGWGDLMVVIESSDPGANVRFAEALQESIRDLPWILHSEFRTDTRFLQRNALLLISRDDLETIESRLRERYEYEVAARDPFFVDLLGEGPPALDFSDIESRYRRGDVLRRLHASADGRTLVLAIYPAGLSGEVKQARAYVSALRDRMVAVDRRPFPADLRARIGGTFKDRIEEYDTILRDLKVSGALMGLLFVGLLLFQFRQPLAIPLIFVTFTMPLFWTFAVARVVVAELNLITVFLVNVLSGLGIDFAIHSLSRYLEEKRRGTTMEGALAVINGQTGRASLAAALTTAVAFWVLIATRFLGFKQFGIIAGVGLSFAFFSAYFVLPSLIAIAEDLRGLPVRPTPRKPPAAIRPRRWTLAAAAGLAGIGAVAATRLEFEHDLSRLRTRVPPESQQMRDTIRAIFPTTRDPVVVLARNVEEAGEVAAVLRTQVRQAGARSPIHTVLSVQDVVPSDQPARLEVIARIRRLLDTIQPLAGLEDRRRIDALRPLLVDRAITIEDLPPDLRRRFFGAPGTDGTLVYALHSVPLADTRRAAELAHQVRTIQASRGTWHAASEAIVVDDLLRVMKEDSVRAVSMASTAVFLVLILIFRSVRRAAIVSIPLVVGVAWMLALVWAAGVKLNFYNMVVFPSILGIGVDSGIHIYHRFLEHPDLGVADALRSTRLSVVTSALTTMISFGSLVASVHRGLASLGLIAVIGLACTLVAATSVFPIVLERYRRWCL